MSDDDVWTDEEWAAFYNMADAFLARANDLIGDRLTDEIAAAMLYGCARFNTFAIQAQMETPATLLDEDIAFLVEEFESHLHDQMDEQVAETPGGRDNPVGGPDRAVQILRGLDGQLESEVSDFLAVADRFMDLANGLVGQATIGRISAAFMHSTARFNVYVMQCLGHPAEVVDAALADAFRDVFGDLVYFHGQEVLVAPED